MTTSGPPIGALVRRLDQLIDERFEQTFGARGVTRRQWQLLRTLADGAATTAQLDEAVAPFLQPGETVVPHLAPLAQRGLVHLGDGSYALTGEGREAFGQLASDVAATRDLVTAGIDATEYERTIATLQTMIDNLAGA